MRSTRSWSVWERWALATVFFVVALLFVALNQYSIIREEIVLLFHPSAPTVVAMAERHFDSGFPREYSIDRAEQLLVKAAAIDPTTPNLFHEMARIAFLRGNLQSALAKINIQIALHGDELPNAYYIRGLIEGFMGSYNEAAASYERYLEFDQHNWAAINDLAWVLLKAKRFEEAERVARGGIVFFPNNPWLHNSRAIALHELGRDEEAANEIRKAQIDVSVITKRDWLVAYPGNDPQIAGEGLQAFRSAIENNMHMIDIEFARGEVQ